MSSSWDPFFENHIELGLRISPHRGLNDFVVVVKGKGIQGASTSPPSLERFARVLDGLLTVDFCHPYGLAPPSHLAEGVDR